MESITDKLLAHVQAEVKAVDTDSRYDDMLDECFSFKSVGGIFASMSPSRVLKECDETAYRCGKNDWADGEGFIEIGDSYYEHDEVEKAREGFADELDSEIKDFEKEIETAEADDDFDLSDLAEMKRKLQDMENDIKEVRDYTF